MTTQQTVVLESAAQEFCDATSHPPFIYQLAPDKAREVLEGFCQELGVTDSVGSVV
jgi:hypothetical protein